MIEKTIEELKDLADSLGEEYHPNIGKEKLIARIEEATAVPEEAAPAPVEQPKSKEEIRKECLALVRIRVNCMNPAKRAWEGEIFTVSSSAFGTVRKYVPFNQEWHVPKVVFDMIQERKCQIFEPVKRKTANGIVTVREGKLIKEFAVEVLPPLTEKELKELAQRQAMASGSADAVS